MINKFFNTAFTAKRMSWSGESSAEIAISSFNGHIQPLDAKLSEGLGLSFTKAFKIWCALDTDVKEGDKLEAGGYAYSIQTISKQNYGNNQHIEIIAERHEDYASI